MATPTTSEFLVVPINGTDLIAFFRGSNISRPLYLRYSTFLDILSQSIGGGTTLLLETNGVQNPSQSLLNLIQGTGITITDNGAGGITIAATGGASFITSITDTADIDLDVTLSDLTATLTTTGVTPNTYGTATQVPQITVDSKGRITGVTLVNITAGAGSVISVATAGLISGGPITVSGTITTSMNTNKLVGRGTAGTGIMEEITLGTNLSLSGTTLNATGGGGVTSVGLSMPSAFTVAGSPVTTSGTLAVTGAGTTSQYVRGDGSLATYNPGTGGGGASVSYYLNGSVNQTPTIGGLTYKQMSKTPVIGAGTDFTINADGYIQSFITDANDPNQLAIPGGNWNFEMFFSASSGGGSPKFYIELYKWDGATLTLIASNSATPENITGGTSIDLYTTAVAVPQTTLALTDRLAIRVYVIHSGRTITLHTEDSHLCQIITTFTTGLTALNGLTDQVQNFATPGTTGTAPSWSSVSPTHTLNIPLASTASVTAGLISKAEYDTFNGKQDAITLTTTGSNGAATFAANTLNIPNYNTSATSSAFYGDGFDGIVNLDGTNTYTAFISKVGSAYTLLRNIFPSSFTIAVGVTLNTNGYQITCNGTSTINGTIGSSGNNGGNAVFVNGGYSTAGAGAISLKPVATFTDQLLVPFTLTAGNGNNGSTGWGNPGGSIACTWYFYGSLGGGGGAGRNGLGVLQPGSTVTITTGKFLPYSGFNLQLNNYIGFASTGLLNSFISVPGGGGGAGAQLGGGWGGAGGGGGGCPFGVKLISNTITISATGLINSNGGNGGNGCGGSLSNWIAGCGGGGGGGGIVYLVTNGLTYTPNNQIKAKGGTGGAGGGPGAGTGAIYTPNPGSNGTDGYIHIYNTFTGTSVFYTGQY